LGTEAEVDEPLELLVAVELLPLLLGVELELLLDPHALKMSAATTRAAV
jgi:hypothetical protein